MFECAGLTEYATLFHKKHVIPVYTANNQKQQIIMLAGSIIN